MVLYTEKIAYSTDTLHIANHKSQHRAESIQLCPFFTSAAAYRNRTDVLYSDLHAFISFNEEVYIGTLKTLYNGAQSLRTGVLQCDFVEI